MKNILLLLIFVCTSSLSFSQLHQEFIEELELGLKDLEETVDIIGLSIAVKSGDDIWADQIGISSISDSLTESSVLAMGSITKTFVSACILQMMEQELLSLRDPLYFYLDQFENIDSSITIKQLLNHTSGIYNYTDHPLFFDEILSETGQTYVYSPEEVLESFVNEPAFNKGTNQEYSNTNYILLGMIISELSERPYYEEIFERFNIAEKYPSLVVPPFTVETIHMANLWADLGFGGLQDLEELEFGINGLFSTAGSAGAFASTPTDMVKWGYDLYTGQLLKENSMDSLFTSPPFNFDTGFSYGLGVGLFSSSCGIQTVGHNGGIAYTADLTYLEEYDLAIAVMTNDGNGIPEVGGVTNIAMEIGCLYETTITNIDDLHQIENSIDVFPNPASGEFTIQLEESYTSEIKLVIFNELGMKVVDNITISPYKNRFQVQELINMPNGMYVLELAVDNKLVTKKIIKI